MELIRRYTKDGLYLLGGHWENKEKGVCVVFNHGMYDNIMENFFVDALGKALVENGYGLIFGHNRGYGVINSIVVRDPQTKKAGNKIIGSTYEKFGECVYDVDMWIETAKELGYSKIILAGHSLGCVKNLYYTLHKTDNKVEGHILVSPPDSSGLVGLYPKASEMYKEAEENIKSGHSKKLLENKMIEIFPISARSFYNFRKGGPIDVFPLVEYPEDFGIFSKIEKPILAILGEKDSVIIKGPKTDMKNIEAKALACKDFTGEIIPGGTHRFIKKDKELGECVVSWLKARY